MLRYSRFAAAATVLARLQPDRESLENSNMHWVGLCEADLLGFLGENFTTVGVRKAIARGHFHHSSVWRDELGFQHAIAQRYCNLLDPHSSRPKLKSYQLSLVSVYNHGE